MYGSLTQRPYTRVYNPHKGRAADPWTGDCVLEYIPNLNEKIDKYYKGGREAFRKLGIECYAYYDTPGGLPPQSPSPPNPGKLITSDVDR